MNQAIAGFLAAFLFAIGLGVSGMSRPSRVLGFLDVGGAWSPALLFVMAGAIAVYAPLFALIKSRKRPVLGETFHIPPRGKIDAPLLAGSVIFGIGWGLGGYCPGPGLVGVGSGTLPPVVFVACMALGMVIRRKTR